MTRDEWDQEILTSALYYTAVRGRNPRTRIKFEATTLEEVTGWAKGFGDKQTMVYAVSSKGSALIGII